jgi:hypothetical protein
MSENLEEYRMKFLVENYKTLREEIVVSINTQSKLIMGEGIAVAAGIILGFLGFGNLSMSSDDKGLGVVSSAFIIAIPFIIFSLTSLWTVEQGRMMRAGDFMQFLENVINRELEGAYIVWENWLRREGVKRLDVHRMHHLAQYLSIRHICTSLNTNNETYYASELTRPKNGVYGVVRCILERDKVFVGEGA